MGVGEIININNKEYKVWFVDETTTHLINILDEQDGICILTIE